MRHMEQVIFANGKNRLLIIPTNAFDGAYIESLYII